MRKKSIITALVIEDDKRIAGQIKWHILTAFNRKIQILTAHTFKDAVEIIEGGLAEIFIVDFGLPDGDGEDLIKMIRAMPFPHPIIVQTTIQDKDYQLKIFKEYDRIKYLTKDTLFIDLTDSLKWAKKDIEASLTHRLLLPGRTLKDSLDMHEVCYIERIANSQNLHIEFYDSETRTYKFKEIKGMSLDRFMKEYNELDIFLRCHNSFIVSKKMIEQVLHLDDELLLIYRGERNSELRIPIGPTYKKSVLSQLKGLC